VPIVAHFDTPSSLTSLSKKELIFP
jgi:hypothetical protein